LFCGRFAGCADFPEMQTASAFQENRRNLVNRFHFRRITVGLPAGAFASGNFLKVEKTSVGYSWCIKINTLQLIMLLKQFSGLGTVVPVLITVLLTGMGLGESAAAGTPSVAQLHETVQNSVCLNDWNRAINAINRLIASDTVSPAYREQMVTLRQQLADYRAQGTAINMNQQPQCAGVAAPRSTAPVAYEFRRPLDWDAAIARFNSAQAVAPTAVAVQPALENDQRNLTRQPESQRTCGAVPEGERRVSNGSISNRWRYDILQSGRSFYGRYWPQENCGNIRTTWSYSTQDDAYDAILMGTQNSREGLGRIREEGTEPMPEWDPDAGRRRYTNSVGVQQSSP
jgi:hypothetical protein